MTDTPPADPVIYHLCHEDDWAVAQANGVYVGSAKALADGFLHLSTATQAAASAAKHMAGHDDLYVLAVRVADLGTALRWEVSRGGALFPHVYGAIPLDAVIATVPVPLKADGTYAFPALTPAGPRA